MKRASPTHGECWLAQTNYDALVTHHTTENSNLKETSCLPLLRAGFEPIRASDTKSPADWHTYMFVVVNFDALAQASDIQIERRHVVFLCWKQDLNPGPQTPIRQHTYIHTYMFVVVNFDALAQASDIRIERRQVVILCWKQDSNLEVSRHLIASRLNAHSQTDWAIEDQAKNFNSTARPYDEWAFSPLDFTAIWLSHLALALYMFVVVNFDALAQASDIRIERRQVAFLCWKQDSNPGSLKAPNRQQTGCPLTNRLSYRGSS